MEFGVVKLNPEEDPSVEHVLRLRQCCREAHRTASEASQRWNARSEFLNEYCTVNGFTEFAARKKREGDWELSDAFDKWSFWEREAKRFESLLMIELGVVNWLERSRPARSSPWGEVPTRVKTYTD